MCPLTIIDGRPLTIIDGPGPATRTWEHRPASEVVAGSRHQAASGGGRERQFASDGKPVTTLIGSSTAQICDVHHLVRVFDALRDSAIPSRHEQRT